ncbi:unnamed protein product, partial [Cyprideis torosa]
YGQPQQGSTGYYYYYYPIAEHHGGGGGKKEGKGGKRGGGKRGGGKGGKGGKDKDGGGFMSGIGKGMKKAFDDMMGFFGGGHGGDYSDSTGSGFGSSGFGGNQAYDRTSRGVMDRVMDVGMGVLVVGALAAAAPAVMSMVQALGVPIGVTGRSLRQARDLSYQLYETAKVKIVDNSPDHEDLAKLSETVHAAIENEECLQRFWCQFGKILKKYKYSQKAVSVVDTMMEKYGPTYAVGPVKTVKRSMELGTCEKYKCGSLFRSGKN